MKHVLESQQFTVEWLENTFFPLADYMKRMVQHGDSITDLKGKRMITFFYEPSTRTRCSFEVAMHMLGGTVVFSTENAREFSSVVKGESLRDTIRVLNRYMPHVIVLRHHEDDGAKVAAEASEFASVINAGAGRGQHPTQALLDLYTIRTRLNRIEGLSVVMVGDLKNGRTIRSLAYLLGKYKDVKIMFVAPEPLKVQEDIKDYLIKHGVSWGETSSLNAAVRGADVVYQTRTQKERGGTMDEATANGFAITAQTLAVMKKSAVILHPLPRNNEIATEVDADPRAAYLTDQISSGLFTRMALLKLLLNPVAH